MIAGPEVSHLACRGVSRFTMRRQLLFDDPPEITPSSGARTRGARSVFTSRLRSPLATSRGPHGRSLGPTPMEIERRPDTECSTMDDCRWRGGACCRRLADRRLRHEQCPPGRRYDRSRVRVCHPDGEDRQYPNSVITSLPNQFHEVNAGCSNHRKKVP